MDHIVFLLLLCSYSIGSDRVWLGGSDEIVEGQWEWTSGRCSFDSFENWQPGQPNNPEATHDYLAMVSVNNYRWQDSSSVFVVNTFICESELE